MFNTENIKKIRMENNMFQADVAKALNVTRSSYAMWESNNNIFPLKRLLAFCKLFNVSLDYALGLTSKRQAVSQNFNKDKYSFRMKMFRKENNLKQKEIADFLHIDQPTWSIYENGKSLIGTPFLYMICKKYKISADYLLGRSDNPKI